MIVLDQMKQELQQYEDQLQEVCQSLDLGFKKHHKTPAAGSKVEYNVVELCDGSIKVEGWQEIEESAQHSGNLHDETDTIPTREGREEGGEK